jgi:hypothetical protein
MIGVIPGNFDVIYPGYILMFYVIKNHVNDIHLLLHINPYLDRHPVIDLETGLKKTINYFKQ